MGTLTLADFIAGVTMLALNAYVVLAGADFGAGVWDLVARGPRAARQRETIEHGIGPIWEANHVWLILVIVLLFGCFPAVYSYISVQLHIPLVLMLIGIVLRGSAFTFRAYDSTGSAVQKHWGRIFAVASTITPVLLGMCVGAIFSGALVIPEGADFVTRYVAPWTTPFSIAMGALTLAVFAFLAASPHATSLSVICGAAADWMVCTPGTSDGYCAKPQPQTIPLTCSTAAARASR